MTDMAEVGVKILLQADGPRHCGECSLCCKLLPMQADAYPPEQVIDCVVEMVRQGFARPEDFAGMMPDFDKPAGKSCQHQRYGKGCSVYKRRPFGCRMWSCRWLTNTDTDNLRRPDRSRYVIDVMPDFVVLRPHDGSEPTNIEVVQIWCDPAVPDAWRDPSLMAFIERRAKEGIAALIRFSNTRAITVFAPPISSDGQWHEIEGGALLRDHRGDVLIEGLARCSHDIKVG